MPPAASSARPRIGMPAGVWALGFVSLFMDISSEMIHALLPVFLVSLGASVAAVGLLEGTAEAIAQVTKVFSGTLSDRLGKRKLLTVAGYGLAALTKPLFALAPSPGWVFAARGLDRVGKGLRGAPRDALIADLTPEGTRGAAFGLRQALDTVGAFAGPLLAIALMAATADSFRTVFWIAVIPAAVSVAVLLLFVREPPRAQTHRAAERPRLAALVGTLGSRFWWLVLVAALFTLARFSEAFLILKAADVGLSVTYVPAVLVVMNVAYALSAYPAGWLSDRVNRWGVFAVGAALLIAPISCSRSARPSRSSVPAWRCGAFTWASRKVARGARRRHRERRAARHCIRRVQPRDGARAARGQRARRRAVGSRRTRAHVSHGRGADRRGRRGRDRVVRDEENRRPRRLELARLTRVSTAAARIAILRAPFEEPRRCFAAFVSIPCRACGPTPSTLYPRSLPPRRSSRAAPTPSAARASNRRRAPRTRRLRAASRAPICCGCAIRRACCRRPPSTRRSTCASPNIASACRRSPAAARNAS